MKLAFNIIGVLILLLVFSHCKTPEEPVKANYYNPYFDQTKKVYVKTPSTKNAKLDTAVLIRSNIRDSYYFKNDTIDIEDDFYFEYGELAVPLELINEKPPTFDTFLIASEYLFNSAYIDLLFPVIADTLLEVFNVEPDSLLQDSLVQLIDTVSLDSISDVVESDINIEPAINNKTIATKAKPATISTKNKPLGVFGRFIKNIFGGNSQNDKKPISKTTGATLNLYKPEDPLVVEIDNLVIDEDTDSLSDTIFEEELETENEIEYYSTAEILDDSTRDLLDADSLMAALINEAPWQIGDSIPFFEGFSNYFLDSALILLFDTVYVEIIDSSKIVPQLAIEELSNELVDTILIPDRFIYEYKVTFRIFYPEDEDVYVDMIRVQGGTFKMGSNYFDEDERPEYKLKVSNFLLGKYEITNSLYCNFLNDLECDSLGEINGHKVIELYRPETKIKRNKFTQKFTPIDGYDDYPVVNVTWVGAQMFCKAVGGRLPSEAEWEYAAKGGIYAKRFYTDLKHENYDYVYRYAGGNYMPELGWIVDNSRGQIWVGGRMKANDLGIYDMGGNVWEWCYDQYDKEFYKRNGDSTDPICLTGGTIRVNRGGCWSSDAMYCRITNRNFASQYNANPYLGFRLMKFP